MLFINISYIGKTKRHLATRIKEHRSEKSAIGQHLQTCHTCDHNFNENQFQILSTSPEARAINLGICLPALPYRQFWYPQVENTLGQLFSVGASQSRIAKQVKCDIKL